MAIAAMKMAIPHSSGFVYDGRSVVLALAGLFGGWLTAGIAVIIGGVSLCPIGGHWVWSGFTKRIENQDKKQVLLIQKMPEVPVYIRTNKERLIQIFSSLLDNSVKFTNQGVIMFGVADVTETHILFFVSDTGIGIEESIRTLIFENFRQADHSITRSYGGTGLGLSIVSGLIGLMDGGISLESEVGKGTVVRFRLPLS
jgi:signal transduction histidine kinase